MSGEKEKGTYGEEWKQQIPPGFRFCPTDQEILQHYLLSYMTGKFILPGIIRRRDVYERNPYHLPGIDTEEKFTYFFSDRAKKYQGKLQTDRVTRDRKGYWKSTSTLTPVYAEDGSYLGKKNTLVYYVKNSGNQNDIKTNWIMHEFLIAKYLVFSSTSSARPPDEHYDDLVVCRIYENHSKSSKQKIIEVMNLINSLIGPNPITTDHNNGEPPAQPSLKLKIEPDQETRIPCATNSNYYLNDRLRTIDGRAIPPSLRIAGAFSAPGYPNQELRAAVILDNMTTTYEVEQSSNTKFDATPQHSEVPKQQNSEVNAKENNLDLGGLSGGDDPWDILNVSPSRDLFKDHMKYFGI